MTHRLPSHSRSRSQLRSPASGADSQEPLTVGVDYRAQLQPRSARTQSRYGVSSSFRCLTFDLTHRLGLWRRVDGGTFRIRPRLRRCHCCTAISATAPAKPSPMSARDRWVRKSDTTLSMCSRGPPSSIGTPARSRRFAHWLHWRCTSLLP